MHPALALFLGHIASGVSRAEQIFHYPAFMADLHQTDTDADIENLVAPHKAVVLDRETNVIGYLAALFQRATHQQHAEFIAAEPRNGIRITNLFLNQPGHFAQHAVASYVSAGIIHRLESIQIQIAKRVLSIAGSRALQRLIQPSFKFPSVDQTGQRIMARLVGHLLGYSAHFGHIVQNNDRADDVTG